jgi:fucose permease
LILLGDSIGGMVLPGLMGLLMERAGAAAMTPVVLGSIAATFLAFLAILFFGKNRKNPTGRSVVG